MATNPKHPEPQEPEPCGDPELEQLLQAGLVAPPPSKEFSAQLVARLDGEFRRRIERSEAGSGAAQSAAAGSLPFSALANPRERTGRKKRRLFGAVAAAAALLVAVSLWSGDSAYGWGAWIRALQRALGAQSETTIVAGSGATGAESWDARPPTSARDTTSLPGEVNSRSIDRQGPQQETPAPASRIDLVKTEDQRQPRRLDEGRRLEPTSPEGSPPPTATPLAVIERLAEAPTAATEAEASIEPLAEPLAADELVAKVDSLLSAFWRAQGIRPTMPASDAEFLRRVYLDLTGRIPMVSEAYQFMEDDSATRRERLVDDLLRRRDHATHLASVWRTMLLPDGIDVGVYGGTRTFDEWLADRFGANIPYNRLVADLLSAEGRVSESGPILFYAALKLNPEELAAKTSRAFLGMRMECAQCHDHPFDDSITQRDFWSFAAYFARISRPLGKIETTAAVLRVRDIAHGEVKIPELDEIALPRLPPLDFRVPTASARGAASPDGTISEDGRGRRRQLVDWLTSPHNKQFASATVNRVWEHLFGRGLVMPIDDMRADNGPLCPELLEVLSTDFAASGYDLRKLLRALVLSDAYQLSSRARANDPSQALAFARMNIKSLSAEQLYDCISVATQFEAAQEMPEAGGALFRFANQSRQAFIEQFRAPPGQRTDYHAGIPQALSLMHGGLVHGATDLSRSGLLKSIEAPFFEDEQRLETLFLATLSHFPEGKARAAMLAHLETATDKATRQQALGDVLWALLNSAEFTFNH